MKDKTLEKAIKNLQKIVDKRRGTDQIEEALTELEEAKKKAEMLEREEELEVPLPILVSIYCGISNGPWWALGGFAVGKLVEEVSNRSEIFYKFVNGFLELIHEVNRDSKKEKT